MGQALRLAGGVRESSGHWPPWAAHVYRILHASSSASVANGGVASGGGGERMNGRNEGDDGRRWRELLRLLKSQSH